MALDIAKWLNDNMAHLQLSDEDRTLALKLASGTFGQRLGSSVVPQSEFNSQLERQKNDFTTRQTELEAANIGWQQAYFNDLAALGAVDRLAAQGFDVSGLQNTRGGGITNLATGESMTANQVKQLLESQKAELLATLQSTIEPMRVGTLEFAEFIPGAADEYRELTGGKRLDARKLREYAFEHRAEFSTLQQAFEAFTADERKAKADSDRQKWEQDKEREIEQRVMSRMQLPEIAPGSNGGSPVFVERPAADATAPTKEQNRQEFVKKFQGIEQITI